MSDKQQFVVICIFLAGFCCALGFECTPAEGYEGCACYTEKNVSFGNSTGNTTKEYVNLLPLKVNSSTPRFTVMDKDGFHISYTPCGVFSEFVGENKTGSKPCVKASVARWTNLSIDSCESLGNLADATFESSVIEGYISSNLTLKFRSPEQKHHSAIISLVCNDTLAENESFFEYVGTVNIPTDIYYLALTSKCCCPGKCGSPPPVPITTQPASSSTTSKPGKKSSSSSSSSLKTWEIIVIVAACVIFVLIIVAIVCFCKKKPGYETV